MTKKPIDESLDLNGVAVVGMSLRIPGANTVDQFWKNLVDGEEHISFFSAEELLDEGIPEDVVSDPDFVRARGLFENPIGFDAGFFGYTARDAELMDPQHRVFLEECWAALEAAGYVPEKIDGMVGVWGGMSTGMTNSTYLLANLHGNPDASNPEDTLPAMLGNENDYLTTRVSYKLDLRGPSVNVQTACSTSLVAISMAFQSLMTYGCDMALAGGVSVSFPQKDGYLYQEGGIGSPDGHCRPFDADANGTVFSNGVGVVTLKRLEDALEDDDTIYAVVRGAAMNNDGAEKMSFAAPSVGGQAEVIFRAQQMAGADPEDITFVECHGTGTPIGDPIEVTALTRAFRESTDKVGFCALGSVKSNVGHLDSTAGVAGFIKAVLALHNEAIPETLHFRKPNPDIDVSNSPFFVNDKTIPWPRSDRPRMAGVSAFGIGGTNAHVVLEEAPLQPSTPGSQAGPFILPVSGQSEGALDANVANLADHLGNGGPAPLADVAFTLQEGRRDFRWRSAVVARSPEDACTRLREKKPVGFIRNKAIPSGAKVAYLLSGGGSQYLGMGRGLYEDGGVFKETVDEGLALFQAMEGSDLRAVWFPPEGQEGRADEEFRRPSLQLPAVFILQMALHRLWASWGIKPDALLGHSLGENTAACIAGVLSFQDTLGLVSLRGRLFEQVEPGGMLSIAASEKDLQAFLTDSIQLAAINGPDQCTLSGDRESLLGLGGSLEEQGIEYQVIPISIAAHSYLVDPIRGQFGAFLEEIELHAPGIPILSNVSGSWLTSEEATSPDYWVDHLRNTVQFSRGVAELLTDPNRVFLEVGPGKILGSLTKLHDPGISGRVVPSIRHREEEVDDVEYFYSSAAALWTNGVDISWATSRRKKEGQRVPLPTYAFQRREFLIAPHAAAPGNSGVLESGQAPAAFPDLTALFQGLQQTPPAPQAAAPSQGEVPVAGTRRDLILQKLTRIIEEMSGFSSEDIDPKESFLDLGFDSLFLTQANLRFRKELKVKITFRQLFDDAPNLDALAEFIDGKLPEEALQDELKAPQEPAQDLAGAGAGGGGPVGIQGMPDLSTLNLAGVPGDSAGLVKALLLQTQANTALLQALTGGQGTSPAVDPMASLKEGLGNALVGASPTEQGEEPAAESPKAKALGPYKPLERGSGGLGESARAALDEFCTEYSERTKKSKELANTQRSVLSDARSISGFRRDWKEIVYQIAAGKGSDGCRVWDLDGNEYVDMTSSFGISLFGHSPEWAVRAVKEQADAGFELGTLSPLAAEAAQMISEFTGMERSTFTNTGSEALAASIRAARTTTAKDRIAVFYDEYHGIGDELLVNCVDTPAGRRTIPTSPGIPEFIVENVLVLKWDDDSFLDTIRAHADELAAVVIEPVQNRNPSLKTSQHFQAIRDLTREHDIALIFDEMITGFRLCPGGAQEYFGVEVDMACYGKVPSGGLPLAVVSGRGDYLDCFDGGPWQFGDDSFPEAGVTFFGGTFTRHPISLATCHAALKHIKSAGPSMYDELNAKSRRFAHRLNELLIGSGYPARIEHCESIFNLKWDDANPFSRLIVWQLRHRGVLMYDRPFFMTTAHTEEALEFVLESFKDSIEFLQASGIVPVTALDGDTRGDREVAFSASQTEIWLATKFAEESSKAYHEQVIYELDGNIDPAALRHAVQRTVHRHEGLRATENPDGEGWIVRPAIHVPVAQIDLSQLSGAEQEEELQRLIKEDVQADFDLLNGPLVRFILYKRSEESFVLTIAAHHMAIDGWSMGILLEDLAAYYGSAARSERFGEPCPDTLTTSLAVESEYLDSEDFKETETFWVDQFKDSIPEPLALPLDRPRPSEKTYFGQRQSVRFGPELAESLTAFCTERQCTVFTTLYAGFSVLMAELTGQTDIVVGVPMAGQAVTGQPRLVGHSVNFLPFRTSVDLGEPFSRVLEDTRNYILDLNDHQRYTYASLLRHIPLKRSPDQLPLVSVTFNVDQGMEAFDFNGIEAKYVVGPRAYVKHDIFFNIVMEGEGILLEVDHNSDILDQSTVRGWMTRYMELLVRVMKDPTQQSGNRTS